MRRRTGSATRLLCRIVVRPRERLVAPAHEGTSPLLAHKNQHAAKPVSVSTQITCLVHAHSTDTIRMYQADRFSLVI